jgi:photosystem II stability/assembly factor-like uncharacterized protein
LPRRLRVRLAAGVLAAGLCAFGSHAMRAQGPAPVPPPAKPIHESDDPLLKPFVFRSIGPANVGGRVDDIAVVDSNPSIIYIGFATGGLWKSTNNGTTWSPIFDEQPVTSIGDIAIAPSDPNVIYVGTGEANNRQSSSFGAGVFKSVDGGKKFEYAGLKETQTTARIVVHPKDPNIAYVAVPGHLFGPNKERGLYKTTDGGKTWTNTKFVDENTGFTDVVMDPSNPNVLYAASYQRRRTPWGFNGGGPGSGLWKTTDGARTWTKLTGNGLPGNPILGRIGLDVARSKPGTIYASIEVGPSGGTGAGVNEDGSLVPPGSRGGGAGRGGRGGANEPPPPPNPDKSGVWRSDDGGKTWKALSNAIDRPMYYSQIRVDPTNAEIAYQGGAPFFKTVDGGKTWKPVAGVAHSDHHAIWIDPHNGNHLIIGNDGGIDVTYDQTETWEYVNTLAVGQFYKISFDMRKPYYVCGGLQDNGSWCGPSAVRSGNGVLNSDWFRVGGGDGFYTAQDPTDWSIVYSESQDGNTNRLDLKTGRTTYIRPRGPQAAGRGGAPFPGAENIDPELLAQFGFGPGSANGNIVPTPPPNTFSRFYWNTPFALSPSNPAVVYLGGDRLFRSADRGSTWTASVDLTKNIGRNDRPIMGVAGDKPMASKHDGAASFSNIVTLAESAASSGVLWVGTNDGNLQISRDGGRTWRNVVDKVPVPSETHVSRVAPSRFDPAACYATFDGHRTDDLKPYVFVTRDFGDTWQSLANGLPEGNLNVIAEDPVNRNLLFLGSEYALYVSLDAGKSWKPFMTGLPTVRIDDILIHPRDHDLIVGTHGRSIWIADDISPLEQLVEVEPEADAHLFDVRPGTAWVTDIQKQILVGGAKNFRGQNPSAGTPISYWLKSAPAGDVKLTISDLSGKEFRTINGTKNAGLNRVQWDLRGDPPARGAGGSPSATGATGATGAIGAGAEGAAGAGAPAAGQGAQTGRAAPPPVQSEGAAAAAAGQGFGRGRGGFLGPAATPGTYVVKLTVNGKEIAQKAVVIDADSLQ